MSCPFDLAAFAVATQILSTPLRNGRGFFIPGKLLRAAYFRFQEKQAEATAVMPAANAIMNPRFTARGRNA